MQIYIPKETLATVGAVEGFEAFAEWVVNTMKYADLTKQIRLKTVYQLNTTTGKEYVVLPNNGNTFIEPVTVNPPRVRQTDSDKFTRTITPDKERAVVNPLEQATSAAPTDLPF